MSLYQPPSCLPSCSAISLTSTKDSGYSHGQLNRYWTMSGPDFDWTEAARRAGMSLALMCSILIWTLFFLPQSAALSSKYLSPSGTKCDHCSMFNDPPPVVVAAPADAGAAPDAAGFADAEAAALAGLAAALLGGADDAGAAAPPQAARMDANEAATAPAAARFRKARRTSA